MTTKFGRNYAIELVGIDAVETLDDIQPTFSMNDIGNMVEFTAWTTIVDNILVAYYYQSFDDIEVHDLDDLDWTISHYEIF